MPRKRTNHEIGVDDLRPVHMLSGMTENELRDVLRNCHGLAIPKGSEIIDHAETSTNVYFLLKGRARAKVFTKGGRNVTYEIVETGETLGELAAIDGKARSAGVDAETDVVVARMSARDFQKLLRGSPDAAWQVFMRLAWLVRWLSGRLFENYALRARGRLYTGLSRSSRTLCVSVDPGDRAAVAFQPWHRRLVSSRFKTRTR